MAGILIETNRGFLGDVLESLGAEQWDCRWLLTGLEVAGWADGQDWTEPLILSNQELLREVKQVQFIWGILSAIPARYTEREILEYPLPEFTLDEEGESCYLADVLLPQHPLAFLEIMCEDSTSVTVIAREAGRLQPLYSLPEWTEDAEARNRRWHELVQVGTGQLTLLGAARWSFRSCPGVPQRIRNDRLAAVWRTLYWHQPEIPIRPEDIRRELEQLLRQERKSDHA